jgi:hypothetical protein
MDNAGLIVVLVLVGLWMIVAFVSLILALRFTRAYLRAFEALDDAQRRILAARRDHTKLGD